MPLLSQDTDLELQKSAPLSLPAAPSASPSPSWLDTMAAAERSSNLAGTLYDRLTAPKPDAQAVPGFDPLTSIPKGYEPFASDFVGADSPQEMQWRRQRIDAEQADRKTISAAGWPGVAASMASGLTDPLTIASMALPMAGETRLASMAKSALAVGATSAAQEAAMQGLQVSRTGRESTLNIAASTVVGGVLGGLSKSISKARFDGMGAKLDTELAEGGERVMGPIDGRQRIIPEENVPFVKPHPASTTPEVAEQQRIQGVGESISEELSQQREGLVQASADFVRGNEPRAAERELGIHQSALKAAQEAHANIPEPPSAADLREPILERMENEDRQSYGDEYDNKQYTKLRERSATKEARETAEQAKQDYAQQKASAEEGIADAQERVTRQQGEVERLTASEEAFKGLKKHDTAIEKAEGKPELMVKAINDEKTREALIKELEPRKAPAIEQALPEVPQTISEAPEGVALYRGTKSGAPSSESPFYSDQRSVAEMYAGEGGKVESMRAVFKRPLIAKNWMEAKSTLGLPGSTTMPDLISAAREAGHDSLQFKTTNGNEYIDLRAPIPDKSELHVNPTENQSFGAAGVSGPTMRGETIARGAQTLAEGPLGQVSPGARLMASPSIQSRRLLQELANLPEATEKNYAGVATAQPIERELWKNEGVHYQGMQARGEAFKTYRERMAGLGQKPLSRGEFGEQIAMAMRRGDVHQIPEVAKAAKDTRRIVFDPLKQRAMKVGALPEDVKATGADSYLMRQYDGSKIRGNLSGWLDTLTRGFQDQGADVAEARDAAHAATRNVLGSERGTMDWKIRETVPESGRLKERTLTLPDKVLEPYLNNNIDHLSHSYLRSMAPEVEMRERFGSNDMADQLADVKDDYARMIERAKDDSEKESLYKRMDKDIRDLAAVRDRLYGIYGQPKDPGSFGVRAGRLLRSVNALRLLGSATLAHFPDLANVMMRYGLPNTFMAVGKVLSSPEAFNLTRSESKRMGAGLDMTMNATASMLGDYANHSQYMEQAIANRLTRAFTITTGETPLITAVQQLTSTMAQDELVRTAGKVVAGQNVDKNLLARMAAAGIDKDMLGRIAEQHDQFGAKVNGLNFGMSDQWTDKQAASAFESAILRDAHSVTLRPGVGDTPLFMSKEWGKTLRQFTTFGYAAQRSVVNPLMQGLAHGDPRAAQAVLALVSMGTLSYISKQTAAGQPIEPFDSPKFAAEVLDKSNLMGWTSDYVFPALWMMGFKSLSRWSDRDPIETIGGPTAGTIASLYSQQLPAKFLGQGGTNEDKGIARSDVHFMRRMMPGQNLWYARGAINSLEDAIGDSFDLPGKSNAERATESAQ